MTAPDLPLAVHHLAFVAEQPVELQAFAGSAWRGAFGHALKRSCCVTRHGDCPACLLRSSCVYPTVFEAAPPEDAAVMRLYPRVPQPYVLRALGPTPCRLAAGEPFGLALTLIGRAMRQEGHVIRALERAAGHGVGRGRGRLRLAAAERRDPERPPDPPKAATVRLLTPLRLVQDGRPLGPEGFRPQAFLMGLVRRVSMLSAFHGPGPLAADFQALKATAAGVRLVEARLGWQDQQRRSARQGQTMRLGGLVGGFGLELRGAEALWPYLWLGQWLHAGKGATMGMGGYRLDAPA